MADRSPLAEDAVAAALAALPGWSLRDGRLHRVLRFAGFAEAFGFMAAVAVVAERLDHHPDWSNTWNVVTVDLWTHDAGALTALDVELARRISDLSVGAGALAVEDTSP